MAEKYAIGPALAKRLPDVVRRVDDLQVGGPGRIPTSIQGLVVPGGGSAVFEATFSGAWTKNGNKQIRFSANTNTTAYATNPFSSIPFFSGQRTCIVATRESSLQQNGAEYVLINAEC